MWVLTSLDLSFSKIEGELKRDVVTFSDMTWHVVIDRIRRLHTLGSIVLRHVGAQSPHKQ